MFIMWFVRKANLFTTDSSNVLAVKFVTLFSALHTNVLYNFLNSHVPHSTLLTTANRQKQDRIRAGARPRGLGLSSFQYVLTSFFHSPTPATGTSHANNSTSLSGGTRAKGIPVSVACGCLVLC